MCFAVSFSLIVTEKHEDRCLNSFSSILFFYRSWRLINLFCNFAFYFLYFSNLVLYIYIYIYITSFLPSFLAYLLACLLVCLFACLFYNMMKSDDSKNEQPFVLWTVVICMKFSKMNPYFKLSLITMIQRWVTRTIGASAIP